jgi:hypothetical protein
MEVLESISWIALGFVQILVFLEMSKRMGKMIGKSRTIEILQQIPTKTKIK